MVARFLSAKAVGGVYADEPVTACDCTVGKDQPGFEEGFIVVGVATKDFVRRELPDGLSFSDVIWHGKTDEEDAVLRGHLRHVLMLAAQAYNPAAKLKVTSESIKDGHGWRITVEEEAFKAATAELA